MNQYARSALEQIAVLAEFGTTGPETTPRCKSPGLSASQATAMRGSISQLARDALAAPNTDVDIVTARTLLNVILNAVQVLEQIASGEMQNVSLLAGETARRLRTMVKETELETVPGTRAHKEELLVVFCDRIRDKLLERSEQWPEEWDGHEIRELAAYAFDTERTLDRPPQPGRPRDRLNQARARKAHNEIIVRNLY